MPQWHFQHTDIQLFRQWHSYWTIRLQLSHRLHGKLRVSFTVNKNTEKPLKEPKHCNFSRNSVPGVRMAGKNEQRKQCTYP